MRYGLNVKKEAKDNRRGKPTARKRKAKVGRFSEKWEAGLDILRDTNANK